MEGDDWTPDLSTPLKSAYFTRYGKEPDFTNYAKVKEDPIFIDTLDYLFYSSASSSSVEKEGGGSIEVKEVLVLPNRETVPGPLPNDEEPSDHLLMAADFTIVPVGGGNNNNSNNNSNSSNSNSENSNENISNTLNKE
jgi:2',5'-phosphodiesterase